MGDEGRPLGTDWQELVPWRGEGCPCHISLLNVVFEIFPGNATFRTQFLNLDLDKIISKGIFAHGHPRPGEYLLFIAIHPFQLGE
jgi:hypothetical protein